MATASCLVASSALGWLSLCIQGRAPPDFLNVSTIWVTSSSLVVSMTPVCYILSSWGRDLTRSTRESHAYSYSVPDGSELV